MFVGQEFELHVTARRGRSLHRCNHRLAITCISSQSNKTLETRIDTVTATLHDGVCCVTLSVLEGAILESNGQPSICYLQVVAVNEDTDLQLTGKTNHFVPVKHKIVIAEDRSERYEFYKDIGGKDKGIELTVSLADARNTIVTSRSLAITPVLLYEDGSVVADQTILQTSDDVSAMHLPEGVRTKTKPDCT
ncbi:hypothetical protein EON64_01070 [archaeon]|nr:MAG: hypothetical protein EON64_01070 [archaeon]